LLIYPAIINWHSINEIKDLSMGDIYATPESDLAYHSPSERSGGNIEDAIAGNIEVNMLETLGEAWRGLKGFKLKCPWTGSRWCGSDDRVDHFVVGTNRCYCRNHASRCRHHNHGHPPRTE
jgi:hypothetical protein